MRLRLSVGAILLCVPMLTGTAYAALKDNLVSSTTGKNTRTGFGDITLDSKSTFDATDEEILWFGQLKLFSASYKAGLKAVWMTPAGEEFKSQDFNPFYWNISYAWAKLDIQGADKAALGLEGEWKVKIFWDGEQIDEKSFVIGRREFKKSAPPLPVQEEDPGTYDGNMELAQAYCSQGKTDRCIAHLRVAKRLEPQKPQPCLLLGVVYNSIQQPDKAILQFSEAEKLGGDAFQIARGRGHAYLKLGLKDKAKVHFGKALNLKPGDAFLKNQMDELAGG